jgi:hypothetical protein
MNWKKNFLLGLNFPTTGGFKLALILPHFSYQASEVPVKYELMWALTP